MALNYHILVVIGKSGKTGFGSYIFVFFNIPRLSPE